MVEARRATLKDVAAASGVSRATVSFVLNDTPNQTISPATRDRVLAAVRELGYKPHSIAKALREGASRLVLLHIDYGLEGNYSRSYIRGLDQELALHDHVLLVRHGRATADVTRQILDTVNPRAVLQFGEPYRTGRELEDRGGGWLDGLAAHAALQVGYLAGRGHTHIALAMPENPPLAEVRLRFTRDALARLSVAPLAQLTVPRPLTGAPPGQSPEVRADLRGRHPGADAVAAFRERHPEVTAIAGYDDDVALRTLSALRHLGLAVPEAVAVIGFDDTEYGGLFTPALTTVHIDAEAHGRLAARTVLGLGAAGLEPTPANVIVRESA